MVTAEGHKNPGRGVVFIRVDPDTEECKAVWTSVSKIGVKSILKLAFAHNQLTHDLLVILPTGRLEGQGYLFSTILRTPATMPNALFRSQSRHYGYQASFCLTFSSGSRRQTPPHRAAIAGSDWDSRS